MLWEILSFIEQAYYQTNLLPTMEKVQEHFNLTARELSRYTRSKEFKDAYNNRGLPNYSSYLKQAETKLLTPKQLMIANVVLNTYDRTSLRQKLKAMDVTPIQFAALQKNPTFMAYLRQESINRLNNADVDARLSLTRLVQDADLNAIKFFYEISGQHTESKTTQQTIDLVSVIAQLMEILVQYLMPAQLHEVADKLEHLLSPNKAPEPEPLPVASLEIDGPAPDFMPQFQSPKSVRGV